jgi:hypothetical protein
MISVGGGWTLVNYRVEGDGHWRVAIAVFVRVWYGGGYVILFGLATIAMYRRELAFAMSSYRVEHPEFLTNGWGELRSWIEHRDRDVDEHIVRDERTSRRNEIVMLK